MNTSSDTEKLPDWLAATKEEAARFSLILGFGATVGAGKDYAASVLARHYPVTRIAFADFLKTNLQRILPDDVDLRAAKGAEKEKWRELMIAYGRAMRAHDPDFWIRMAFLNLVTTPCDNLVVFTDVRYANEVRAIQDLGGKYIHIRKAREFSYANAEEARNAPEAEALADEIVRNDYSPNFDAAILGLVHHLGVRPMRS